VNQSGTRRTGQGIPPGEFRNGTWPRSGDVRPLPNQCGILPMQAN
jgi:hypothetical protein